MAQPITTSSKARWGIPLVLPHVLLAVGLLIFVCINERPAAPGGNTGSGNIASVVASPSVALVQHQLRRI